MKKVICIVTVGLFGGMLLFAQEHNVIATAGGTETASVGSISWTLGETVSGTFTAGNKTLTQGFQQSKLIINTHVKNTDLDYDLKVYPNPVVNILNIETSKNELNYQLFNLNGKIIIQGILNGKIEKIDLSEFPIGSYILKIGNVKTHTIIKQ